MKNDESDHSLEAEITNTLKGREPKEPVEVPEDLEEAWKALPTEQQQSYRRLAAAQWPEEKPEKLPGETRATHSRRAEAAEVDRQVCIDRDSIKAFKRAKTPGSQAAFGQGIVDAMGPALREQSAALRRDAAAKAEEQEQLQKSQRERARRESGGLGGSCRQV